MKEIMKIFEKLEFGNGLYWAILPIALIYILAPVIYGQQEPHKQLGILETKHPAQTTCPVMVGNPIDTNIYTDYEGKRVYFCCNSCKTDFEKNPEKYLSNLPQFASALESGHNNASHEPGDGLPILFRLIEPVGVVTLSLVAVTVVLSVFRRVNARLMMKWHKRTGIAALISGVIHAALVLIAH